MGFQRGARSFIRCKVEGRGEFDREGKKHFTFNSCFLFPYDVRIIYIYYFVHVKDIKTPSSLDLSRTAR